MDALLNNPFLQPQYVNKLMQGIPVDDSMYALKDSIPFTTYAGDKVVVDVEYSMGGMTQAATRGAESPIVEQIGASQFEFKPALFREKVALSEKDIHAIRKLGTAGEVQTAAERVAKTVKALRHRIEARIEWSKWEMIRGSLSIAQNDIQFTVDYNVPAEFTPTAADLWNTTNGDPVVNMQEWEALFESEASEPEKYYFNKVVMRALLQNEAIRTLRDSLLSGQSDPRMISVGNLDLILKQYIGDREYQVYDKGYPIVAKLETALGSATTTFSVDDATGIEDGDVLKVIHAQSGYAGLAYVTVSGAPSGNSITIAAGHGQAGLTFPIGSIVTIRKKFIKDDEFIIMGAIPPGTIGIDTWAEFISTNHYYGPNGLDEPQQGMFIRVDNKVKGDPPTIEIVSGVYGLPASFVQTNNVVATVL